MKNDKWFCTVNQFWVNSVPSSREYVLDLLLSNQSCLLGGSSWGQLVYTWGHVARSASQGYSTHLLFRRMRTTPRKWKIFSPHSLSYIYLPWWLFATVGWGVVGGGEIFASSPLGQMRQAAGRVLQTQHSWVAITCASRWLGPVCSLNARGQTTLVV